MVSPQWNENDDAQQALRAIISNPVYGIDALSRPQTMANLLKDLLPDAPREVSILIAAAEAGVAANLRERVSQGMDVGTASAVVAGSFAASTPYKPEACNWAVSEIAGALGLSKPPGGSAPGSSVPSVPGGSAPGSSVPSVPGGSAPGSSVPSVPGGDSQPTISAPVLSGPGPAPLGFPPANPIPPLNPVPPANPFSPAYAPPGPGPAYAPPGPGPGPAPGGSPPGQGAAGPYPPATPFPGQAPGGYPPPPPGYWSPAQAPGFVPVARTNGLAIASLVLGVLWLFWLGSLVGLILGLVALKQIKGRRQAGRGIAIAGVVLSVLWLVGFIVAVIVGAANGS